MDNRTTFIVCRHGSYDGNANLSPNGIKQMKYLVEKVKEINSAGLPVALLCSTAPRAEQGGEILIKALDIPAERTIFDESLWEDNGHCGDGKRVRQLIDEHIGGGAILLSLSHLDMVPSMAYHVAQKFGHTNRFSDSDYGCGWLINSAGCAAFPNK